MKEILIVSRIQFGYNTDRYKWCEYLKEQYKVTHLAVGSREKYYLDGIRQINICGKMPRSLRGAFLFIVAIFQIFLIRGIVIIAYFPHCNILRKLFPKKKMILDVRTMSVETDPIVRDMENAAIRKTATLFDRITAISQGLADQLKVDKEVDIVPLGAEVLNTSDKSFEKLHLLYVGTLFNRDIDKTIRGFAIAKKRMPKNVELTYDIIGSGPNGENIKYAKLIEELGMEEYIKLHGYIHHSNLNSFFEKCNVGISYVPITPYYEHQPVTKTFEYALAGLFVLATATHCNREVIVPENGVLINDDEESFANGIIKVFDMRNLLNSSKIKNTLKDYSWENIVKNQLIPIIESV